MSLFKIEIKKMKTIVSMLVLFVSLAICMASPVERSSNILDKPTAGPVFSNLTNLFNLPTSSSSSSSSSFIQPSDVGNLFGTRKIERAAAKNSKSNSVPPELAKAAQAVLKTEIVQTHLPETITFLSQTNKVVKQINSLIT
jgi:hypothetical protein